MGIIENRKIFYIISGLFVGASIFAISFFGLNLGIDFRGGSLLEISYAENRPDISTVSEAVAKVTVSVPSVRPIGDNGYIIRMIGLDEAGRQDVLGALSLVDANFTEERFNSVGPLLGKESARKSLISIILVLVMIVLFIAFAFRHVSQPVSSWKYGLIAIVALAHDVIVPTGVFAFLAYFNPTIEIDTLFVTALLVILGFSIHDTIVVFDRVRENLKFNKKSSFEEIVGASVNQTIVRSINTSLTTALALIVLYIIGGSSVHNFTLVLIIGIIAGTYSSIFLASPLLVTVEKWGRRDTK